MKDPDSGEDRRRSSVADHARNMIPGAPFTGAGSAHYVSRREPNRRRSQQVFDDVRREFAPFDTDARLEFPRDMRLEHVSVRRWRWQFDADLDERVKTQIAIGLHERPAQTEVLH